MKSTKRSIALALLLGFVLLGTFASAVDNKALKAKYEGKTFFLQFNLYNQRNVSWVNFIGNGKFIPIGTKVTVKKVDSDKLIFTAAGETTDFTFDLDKCVPDIETIVDRTFGAAAPSLEGLSEADQSGVKIARIMKGMSRKGVFLAVGYPPMSYAPPFRTTRADNPDLKAKQLSYLKNRFDFMIIEFEGDIVANIVD
jgi:hypothetical protein